MLKPTQVQIYRKAIMGLLLMAACLSFTGCTAVLSPIDTVPANRVPPQFLAEPESIKRPIDVSRLRQVKPENYILDSGDVLGVFIEEVLGALGEAPPVRFPDPGSDLPPSMGFPVPVREDGTVSLPLVDPIPVRGLTVQQAEQLIKRTYTEGEEPILNASARFITTLIRERTYRVFVVRQDGGAASISPQVAVQQLRTGVNQRSDFSSRGFVLNLPAYQNDVFTALSQTGGLPGINAKSEIRVLRGDRLKFAERDRDLLDFYKRNDANKFPYGIIPEAPSSESTIRIPTRLRPGEVPNIRPEDIILRDGDVVYVDSRETDVYYTGGLLNGGEFPLPRDYDLDVLTAISRAGFSAGVGQNRAGILGSAGASVPPSQLIVLRRLPGNQQIAIEVDLTEAINSPQDRILIRPGDTLILRFRPREEVLNFISNTFFTFGIRQLLR